MKPMTDEEAIEHWIDTAKKRVAKGGSVPTIYRAIERLQKENEQAQELLVNMVEAAKRATESYPKDHENEGAYIVAFGEYERLGELEEAIEVACIVMPSLREEALNADKD